MMHYKPTLSTIVSATSIILLSGFITPPAIAGDAGGLSHPQDPRNLLPHVRQRSTQKDSLFPVSPLTWLHDSTNQAKQDLYAATHLKLGLVFTHLFQGLSESLPDEDRRGTSSQLNFVGTWELLHRGKPTQGQFYFDVEGRWDYGTTGPTPLGAAGLGSSTQTANGYAEYDPTFIVRNGYWHQGSPQAGWSYRLGKITPDQILSTSSHLSPFATFLPTASTGPFAMGLPDSGFGTVGAWYVNDRATLVGLVSDANADRTDSGDIGEGDFFTAAELQFKIAPRTPKAGYSKLTLWHTDGTEDGRPINGQTGPSGWGVMGKLEHELTADGRAIGILRYGKSFDNSALYEQLASAHFLLYDPPGPSQLQNDLIGMAFTWATVPQSGTRGEYNAEVFYRFPIFPHVDTTLSYQSVFNPAFDRDNDHASVYSLRLRTSL
ncbi:MAG: carbohydrate porin [Gammaproteobacteria bacterium]|nr:carbohydrate porin [Gammaproteobacteria bacterium]